MRLLVRKKSSRPVTSVVLQVLVVDWQLLLFQAAQTPPLRAPAASTQAYAGPGIRNHPGRTVLDAALVAVDKRQSAKPAAAPTE